MRFVFTEQTIEYWRTNGEILKINHTPRNRDFFMRFVVTFNLTPQCFNDRVIYTEYYA